ncbi:MAG: hypothetical protein QFC55_04745 [Chloroflexota bacterium]|nr:hypothetical protein [Chloroflexota bacterium]
MRAVTVLICACLSALLALACAPAALTQEQIVPAFVAASQADSRTMHMEWQGTMHQVAGGDQGSGLGQIDRSLSGAFDFNGPDYAGSITTAVAQGGGANQISYARVGGVSFVNYSESGWQSADAFGAAPSELDPMHDLAEAGLTYEAADTLDGRAVHRLRVLDAAASLAGGLFDQASFMGGSLTLNGPSDYLIYVDANGIPVGAHVALDIKLGLTAPDMASPDLEYQIEFDYTFSLWGEPVTISPPNLSNNGGGIDFPPPPRVEPSL